MSINFQVYLFIVYSSPEYRDLSIKKKILFTISILAGIITTTTESTDTTTISQEPTIEVLIEDPNIGIYEVGSSIRYNCSARSRITPGVSSDVQYLMIYFIKIILFDLCSE